MFSLNGTYECVANGMSVWGGQVTTSVPAGVIIEGADMGLQVSQGRSYVSIRTFFRTKHQPSILQYKVND